MRTNLSIFALALCFSACAPNSAPQAEKNLADAKQKLAEAQKQVEAAQRQVDVAQKPVPDSRKSAPPPHKPLILPAGTPIAIRTTTALSTKSATASSPFAASLAGDLIVDGAVVAPKGAEVSGVVTRSDPGGRVKGVASLAITIKAIETPSGKLAVTASSYATAARSSVKKDVVKGGIMSGVGAAVGAIAGGGKGAAIGAGIGAGAGAGTAMATRGDPAVIPAESLITLKLTAPVTVP